MRINFDIIFIN